MATYNLFTLFDHVAGIINDGLSCAEITEFPAEEELPTRLGFSILDPYREGYDIDCESVDSVSDNTDALHASLTQDKICFGLTLKEVTVLHYAITNAMDCLEEWKNNPACTQSDLEEISESIPELTALQSKAETFLSKINL